MEIRTQKVNIRKAGGNASSEAKRYSIQIPTEWAKQMGIMEDSRKITLSFDGEKIIIEKDH